MAKTEIISEWTWTELALEVKRLRKISERQSSMLAQALFEKNHLTSAGNAATEAFIDKLERRNTDLQNAYVSLRKRFEEREACHAADYALLNRLKSILKDLQS